VNFTKGKFVDPIAATVLVNLMCSNEFSKESV
jgi:hypothetical protein